MTAAKLSKVGHSNFTFHSFDCLDVGQENFAIESISEQFHCNFTAISKQNECNNKNSTSEQFQSNFSANPEQFQCKSRAISEQNECNNKNSTSEHFQSSFRAIPEQFQYCPEY